MTERIQGKVARINSDRELIINRGSTHGVDERTYFAIKGDPIAVVDPDTDEPLGTIAPIKVVVQVEEVAEKFCIARTFRSYEVLVREAETGGKLYGLSMGMGLNEYLQPPRPAEYETRVETLRLDPKKGESISAEDSVVEVGDVAESLLPGEDKNPVTTTLFR